MLSDFNADMQKVRTPKAFLQFCLAGLLTETSKVTGCCWVWDVMYKFLSYEAKMLDPTQQARYSKIKDTIAAVGPSRMAVLDVGCGTANGFQVWNDLDIDCFHGIDVSDAAIQTARKACVEGLCARIGQCAKTCALRCDDDGGVRASGS